MPGRDWRSGWSTTRERPAGLVSGVIGSGLLEAYGVRRVSVAGHPGGHPVAANDVLWPALAGKAAALERRGLAGSVITQFGFDAGLVLAWLAGVRARGVRLPVRVGVPGPAGVRRLLSYASRCGVSVSAGIAGEYGFALTDLTGTAGPDRFIRALASGYDARLHGEVKLHFYSFSGITATAEWISAFRGRQPRNAPAPDGRAFPAADPTGCSNRGWSAEWAHERRPR